MLRIVVLGAAAGGGVPQWNCGCPVCARARGENPDLISTQASIAFSRDGAHWYLVNASPDLRQQLIAAPQLHPAKGQLRHSPIAGVILTNGEIDAVAGLLSMREGSPFSIYAHPRVLAISGFSLRAFTHTGHPQFHCGTPPPAAAPRTTMRSMIRFLVLKNLALETWP